MVVVIGIGNILQGDEGLGVHFIQQYGDELRRRFPGKVETIDGGTVLLPLLDWFCQADGLILIDAIEPLSAENDGQPAGTIVQFEREKLIGHYSSRCKLSAHSGGVHELLATAELLGELPARIELIGIVPERISGRLDLSVSVNTALPLMRDLLFERIDNLIG